jgi:hypothetical protein
MHIPVELRLQSDDGLLDETVELSVWSECGTQASLFFTERLEALDGALAASVSGLPEAWSLEVDFGFFEDRMWFGLYVGSSAGLVLSSDLAPFGAATHDVARKSVEQQQGAPLPSESACKHAY